MRKKLKAGMSMAVLAGPGVLAALAMVIAFWAPFTPASTR